MPQPGRRGVYYRVAVGTGGKSSFTLDCKLDLAVIDQTRSSALALLVLDFAIKLRHSHRPVVLP